MEALSRFIGVTLDLDWGGVSAVSAVLAGEHARECLRAAEAGNWREAWWRALKAREMLLERWGDLPALVYEARATAPKTAIGGHDGISYPLSV